MQSRLKATCLAGLILCALPLRAQVLVTVNDSNDNLQRIDGQTLAVTNIGPLGVAFSFGDLAWNPFTSVLYMIDGRGAKGLYTVNVNTGAATLVGIHGITDLFGLAFDTQNNTLYAATFGAGTLYSLNTTTGAATAIGNAGVGIGGLAYDFQRNIMIGIADGNGTLYQINLATGASTFLANPGGTNDSGLTFDGAHNRLLDIDYNGNLYSYDIANNYARTTLLTGLGSHDGLANISAAVPEPGVLALLLSGLGLMGARWVGRRGRRAT